MVPKPPSCVKYMLGVSYSGMKKNIGLILIALILIISAVFIVSKFYSRKTIVKIAPKTLTTLETAPDPAPQPLDFINQSAIEVDGGRNNKKEAPKVNPPASNKSPALTASISEPICAGALGSTFQCYEKFYTDLVGTQGIPAAFADIKIRENGNSFIKSQCHPLTHSIGHAAAGLFPDILDAFANGDSFCWSGYYHGILEEIIDTMGKEKTLANLNSICSRVPGKETYSFDYYNCVHGLGHGLMGTAGQNLFDALTMCDKLTGQWEKSSCYSGVFMENVIIDNKGGSTEYLRPGEPIYPCNAVANDYKQVCFLMQTSYMLKVTGNNFSKVFDLCSQVESPYQATCYQSLGRDASGQSSSNVEKTVATCGLGTNFEQKSNCIIGAVKDFISYYHSDVEAKKFCDAHGRDLRDICLTTAEDYYESF